MKKLYYKIRNFIDGWWYSDYYTHIDITVLLIILSLIWAAYIYGKVSK